MLADDAELRHQDSQALVETQDAGLPAWSAMLKDAIEQRDYVIREGLLLGIERAWARDSEVIPALEELKDSETDQARRAYARAALKAIGVAN